MKDQQVKADGLESGYWLYSDGWTVWGIAILRNGEKPIKIDQQTFKETIEKRLEHYATAIQKAIDDKVKEDSKKK